MARSGRQALTEGRKWLEGLPGGTGEVRMPSWRDGSGREALPKGLEALPEG